MSFLASLLTGILATISGFFAPTLGASLLSVPQGGTASSTLSGILIGNGTGSVKTTTIGTGLTLTGTTLTASGGGTGNVATSTTETAGQLPYWTSTGATPATLGKVATGTVSGSTNIAVTAGQSIIGSGLTVSLTGTVPYLNGGTGSTTAPQGQIIYGGATAYQSVASSSLGVSAPITFSGTMGAQVGGVGGTFGCTSASTGVKGCLTGADWDTFNGKQATISATWPIILSGATLSFGGLSTSSAIGAGANVLYATGVNTVASAATGTVSGSTNIAVTAGQSVIGSGLTISLTGTVPYGNGGTGSTTAPQGQLLYGGATAYQSVATGTVSAGSTRVTVTAGRSAVGGALAIDCATASASQDGCLAQADWTTFNGKAGFAWPWLTATNFAQTAFSTTTSPWYRAQPVSLMASSTAWFDQLKVGSSTTNSPTGTSTFFGGVIADSLRTTKAPTFDILTSALILTDSVGSTLEYGGAAACTNQVVTALSATGASTCTTITSAYVDTTITPSARTITINGTTDQITSSAGAQDLTSNRTWTLSIPDPFRIAKASTSLLTAGQTWVSLLSVGTTTSTTTIYGNATSTFGGGISVTNSVKLSNLISCTEALETDSSGNIYCGTDATTAGAAPFTWTSNFAVTNAATTSMLWAQSGLNASSTSNLAGLSVGSGIFDSIFGTNIATFSTTSTSTAQVTIYNPTISATSSADLIFGGDKLQRFSYYGDLGCNSSGNKDLNFTITNSDDCYLYISDANLAIGTASSSAASSSLKFFTGGTLTTNERARFTGPGLFGYGSTTPWAQFSINPNNFGGGPEFVIGSSTKTDFLVDTRGFTGHGTTSPWAYLSINANNFLGTAPAFAVGSSTKTDFIVDSAGRVGVGTTTPWAKFSINPTTGDLTTPPFAIGSSSQSLFVITNKGHAGFGTTSPMAGITLDNSLMFGSTSGAILVRQKNIATSTNKTVECLESNTLVFPIGASATTITLLPMSGGQSCAIWILNPNAVAGTITWATTGGQIIYWTGGTAPTQTTTANKRDVWTFKAIDIPSLSSSTSATIINGAQTPNF